MIAEYANRHGESGGKPYFAKGDGTPFSMREWELMRAKFHCELGVSNVWHYPAVRGKERIRNGTSCLHMNQKPLNLLEQLIRSSSDLNDNVWEPFGGLCSVAIASLRTGRRCYSAELNRVYYENALRRIEDERDRLESI